MSVIALARNIGLGLLLTLHTYSAKGEYAEGSLSYEWNEDTKEFGHVYRDWHEGIVRDEKTGDFYVTYKDGYGGWNEVLLEPATKTDPSLASKWKLSEQGRAISYEYKLKNGAKGKQNIHMLQSRVSNITSGPWAPAGWKGYVFPTLTDSNLLLSWSYEGEENLGGLAPGKSAEGFGVESNDLPGVAIVEVAGAAQPTTWLGHSPAPETQVGKQVLSLEANNFTPRPAAVPRIPNPAPFNATAVLSGVAKHLNDDLVAMKLVDSSFVSTLNRPLQAALDAVKINNLVGAHENLKQFRKLLKDEYADVDRKEGDGNDKEDEKTGKPTRRIDRLAARVLDFDARYVLKRLEEKGRQRENDGGSEHSHEGGR